MSSGASKVHFLQHVDSKEDKKFSKTVTTLNFVPAKADIVLFKYVKTGAQGGPPEGGASPYQFERNIFIPVMLVFN